MNDNDFIVLSLHEVRQEFDILDQLGNHGCFGSHLEVGLLQGIFEVLEQSLVKQDNFLNVSLVLVNGSDCFGRAVFCSIAKTQRSLMVDITGFDAA